MAQPVNSALSVAQLTYALQLTSQWMNYSIGSSSASLLNPPNSQLEVFNLINGTFINANYQSIFNASNDNIYSLKTASAPRAAGLINPAHLRLSAHFQGTGSFAPAAGDNPVYNSNNGSTGMMFIQGTTTLTAPNLLVSGTPSATSAETANSVANAFDGSQVTFWASVAPNILPTSDGIPSISSYEGVLVGSIGNAFDGNAASTVETGTLQFTFAVSWPHPTGSINNVHDFGAGNAFMVRTFTINGFFNPGTGSPHGSIWLSNDGVNYTQIFGDMNLDNGPLTLNNPTPMVARYFKIVTTDPGNSYTQTGTFQFFQNLADQPAEYKYQLGSGESFAADSYSIAAPTVNKQPLSWTLQGSNDGTSWTVLDTQTNYAGSFPFSGTFVNSTSYSYYKVSFTASTASTYNNELVIQDIKIWNSATSSPFITSGAPQNLTYDLGAGNAKTGTSYTLNSSLNAPTSWTLQASNDNSTWTTLDTETSYGGTFPFNKNFTNSTPYRYWRIAVTASQYYNDVVTISNFQVSDLPTFANYDTSVKQLGTSSLQLRYTGLRGSSLNTNEVQLGALPWQFRAFVNLDSGFPEQTSQCVFTILGKQLEIHVTNTGLKVNYSTDGSTFTTVTANFVFTPGTWYWIAVGRDSNNLLHLNVNGTDIGTADLTGITLFNTNQVSPNFYIGMDSAQANPFIGHIQEVEMFVAECPAFTVPGSIRSTAYIPAINWESKANYIPTDATTITALIFIDESTFASVGNGVPIANTDWFLNVSCDNGATFTNIPVAKISAFSTLTNVYSAVVNAPSGSHNTSQLVYQITSASGKVLKYDGLILYWVSKSSLYPFYNNSL